MYSPPKDFNITYPCITTFTNLICAFTVIRNSTFLVWRTLPSPTVDDSIRTQNFKFYARENSFKKVFIIREWQVKRCYRRNNCVFVEIKLCKVLLVFCVLCSFFVPKYLSGFLHSGGYFRGDVIMVILICVLTRCRALSSFEVNISKKCCKKSVSVTVIVVDLIFNSLNRVSGSWVSGYLDLQYLGLWNK